MNCSVGGVFEVSVSLLVYNPKYWPPEDCQSYYGALDEPFRVKQFGKKYFLLDGHHRLKAALAVGIKTLRVFV
jgi:hypothetical protein